MDLTNSNRQHIYLLDPHGAVAYNGARRFLTETREPAIAVFLETAHPAKFREVMEDTLGESMAVPAWLQEFAGKQEHIVPMQNSFEELNRKENGGVKEGIGYNASGVYSW